MICTLVVMNCTPTRKQSQKVRTLAGVKRIAQIETNKDLQEFIVNLAQTVGLIFITEGIPWDLANEAKRLAEGKFPILSCERNGRIQSLF